ncbi:MAG: hypothetical protein GXX09_06730 [Syntrophomonadaceae bacterium]|nr:hypothetical protein [Syntrophomonadaceae bacterium]
MAEVRPGRCPIVQGVPQCPPPTEIDCIKVKKVFQECKEVDVEKVIFPIEPTDPEDIEVIQCISAKVVGDVKCEIPVPGRVNVNFDVKVKAKVIKKGWDIPLEKTIHVFKTVRLSRAGERGLSCEVDIPLVTCLECFVSKFDDAHQAIEVTCCVGKLLLFKLVSEVQLLVPTYGYCPEPPECPPAPLGECPEFSPPWPPFPPQATTAGEPNGSASGTGGCCGE